MNKSTVLHLTASVALIATLGFTHATASDTYQKPCQGFVPENNLKIPVGMQTVGGITEVQFNEVIDRLIALYTEDTEKMGDKLSVIRRWTDPTVNAYAERVGNTQKISMYGGLARHPTITVEGMALVICHELGHHQGGAPKKPSYFGPAWATNEGGSDYFASLKCLRRFFAQDDNAQILAGKTLDPVAVARCEEQFQDIKDQEICMRTSLASQSVSYLFQALKNESTQPAFNTPDKSEVRQTNDSHPATQCRMDTMFAGMSCHVPESDPVDKLDYKKGSCYTPNDQVGFRPRCWFFPGSR